MLGPCATQGNLEDRCTDTLMWELMLQVRRHSFLELSVYLALSNHTS